eukprot:2883111-Lingulodinium_polyedra.AAC.1
MHTVCLGVAAHACGSALYTLVLERPHGVSAPAAVDALFTEIKDLYAVRGTPNKLNNLRLTMIKRSGEFAHLTASAAET